jgi:RNA polymerase sigma factor (sigma-70 family)
MEKNDRTEEAFRRLAEREEDALQYRRDPTYENRQRVVRAFTALVEWILGSCGVPWPDVDLHSSEIMDETLEFDHIRAWDPSRGTFHGWIRRRATYRAKDAVRDVRRHNEILDEGYRRTCRHEDEDAETFAIRDEEFERAREAIRRLPKEQQLVVLLKFYDGMSLREISEETGASHWKVRDLYRKGVITLKRLLA